MANNGNELVLTTEGKTKLEEELHYLETEKRDEVGERIRIAREFGDISENSEYDDAKNEQAFVEQRIAEINQILANAKIVESPKRGNKAVIGSTVTLEDAKGHTRTFTIVGGAEADAAEGKISIAMIRDMIGTSRKSAKPLLEYLDNIRVTRRNGTESERVAY